MRTAVLLSRRFGRRLIAAVRPPPADHQLCADPSSHTCLSTTALLSRSSEKMLEESELSGVLNLTGRKLKEFPNSMASKYDMSDLVSVDLSDNRLVEIPTCICESRSLESVCLRGNALRSIPSNIVFLHSLTVLDLSNNKIVHLPLGLFELPLEIILLTGNRLESIPREIRQLSTTLAELDVSCNFLKSVPADIALLKMLRVLNLRKNLLEQFPSVVRGFREADFARSEQ
ncbi:unnamed protein product [Angiostrongylus costaricensis]|uniref:Leucine-rich repeat-containing protein 40 n=1 Tax=Angiostrongylus costaricensis TaxID=334426 RepID=A0A0R3PG63_ANGCS|nr:unnamed protein product [Angiostrongylus costaricensis]